MLVVRMEPRKMQCRTTSGSGGGGGGVKGQQVAGLAAVRGDQPKAHRHNEEGELAQPLCAHCTRSRARAGRASRCGCCVSKRKTREGTYPQRASGIFFQGSLQSRLAAAVDTTKGSPRGASEARATLHESSQHAVLPAHMPSSTSPTPGQPVPVRVRTVRGSSSPPASQPVAAHAHAEQQPRFAKRRPLRPIAHHHPCICTSLVLSCPALALALDWHCTALHTSARHGSALQVCTSPPLTTPRQTLDACAADLDTLVDT